MVFSSVSAYFDPPSWNQQQQPYEQPPSASSGGGGGEAGRPGSMSDHARLSKILPQPPSAGEPALKCPRCESTNTKFCYFNNYSLSQPRHFCKTCRRYWTRGGSLRNVPVGGGCRRNNKRTKSSSTTSSSSSKPTPRQPATSTAAAATAANNNNLILPSHQFPFMNSFHPLNDYGGSGSNLNLGFAGLEHGGSSSGAAGVLEHWKAQQMSSFPFLGRMESSLPTPPVGLPMTGIVMQAAAAAAAKVEGTNMEQMSSLPGNDQYNYWGGGHGNGWSTSELASGFNSLSSGNFL